MNPKKEAEKVYDKLAKVYHKRRLEIKTFNELLEAHVTRAGEHQYLCRPHPACGLRRARTKFGSYARENFYFKKIKDYPTQIDQP